MLFLLFLTLPIGAGEEPKRADHLSFGYALAAPGDVDGDGLPDLWIGAPSWSAAHDGPGRAWLVSGSDGHTLATSSSARSGFGSWLASGGDADADGVHDLLATLDSGLHPTGTCIEVRTSKDGAVLWTKDLGGAVRLHSPTSCFLPDLDGDGCDEVAVGSAQSNDGTRGGQLAWILSGKDGRLLSSLRSNSTETLRARDLAFGGDLDGDGATELAILAQSVDDEGQDQTNLLLFSLDGRGAERRMESIPSPLQCIARIDEGDGCSSLALGAYGNVLRLAGGSLAQSWRIVRDPVDRFGCALTVLSDMDGDGTPDLAIDAENTGLWSGSVHVVSGRDQRELYRLDEVSLGVDEDVHRIGRVLVTVGDVDGDGASDFAAGSDNSRGGLGGRAFLLSGRTGIVRFEFLRDRATCFVSHSWRDQPK